MPPDQPTIPSRGRHEQTPSRQTVPPYTPPDTPPQAPGSLPPEGRPPLAEYAHRYELDAEPIAAGGMGEIWLAYDHDLDRQVAVKVLRDKLIGDVIAFERFAHETWVLAQLDHPGVVPIYDRYLMDEPPCYTMKVVRGGSLAERIRDVHNRVANWRTPEGQAALRELLAMVISICHTLAFAHSRRIIHRDLKPANVMVGAHGETLVLDWGLARALDGRERPSHPGATRRSEADRPGADLTVAGDVIGTPAYMPPEQARGRAGEPDARSDIFAIGGILYCALTGEDPYRSRTAIETLAAAWGWKLIEPTRRAASRGIPPELAAITMKAMAKDPADRYRAAEELAADLEAWQAWRPVSAHHDTPLQRLVKFTRRRPTTVMMATVTLLFLSVLGVVVSVMLAERERVARAEADQRRVASEERERADAAEQEKMRALASEGRWEEIGKRLGVTIIERKDNARAAFYELVRKLKAEGLQDHEVERRIAASPDAPRFVEAFRKLMIMAETGTTVTAQDHYHYGALLLAVGPDPEGAIEQFEAALGMKPEMANAWSQLARACDRTERLDRAREAFRKAAELRPRVALHHYNLGAFQHRHKEDDHGIAELTRAIELRETFGEAYAVRAEVHLHAERWEDAAADATHAIRLRIDHAGVYRLRGTARFNLHQYEDAAADFDAAIELDPGNADLLYVRGFCRERMKDYTAAEQDFAAAIRTRPDHAKALAGQSRIALVHRNLPVALEFARRACQADVDDVDARLARGVARSLANRHKQAINDFDFVIERRPTPYVWFQRGVSRQFASDTDGAIADYTAVIDAGRAHRAEAYNNRGKLLGRTDRAAALRDARAAIALEPGLWQAYHLQAMCLLGIDSPDPAAALASFRRARELLARIEPESGQLAGLDRSIRELERQLGN